MFFVGNVHGVSCFFHDVQVANTSEETMNLHALAQQLHGAFSKHFSNARLTDALSFGVGQANTQLKFLSSREQFCHSNGVRQTMGATSTRATDRPSTASEGFRRAVRQCVVPFMGMTGSTHLIACHGPWTDCARNACASVSRRFGHATKVCDGTQSRPSCLR